MRTRFIYGRHPLDGSYGVWLSKPGIDAASTVNPDDFLICPYRQNEQILLSGSVTVPPNDFRRVFYPETYNGTPFVAFYSTLDGGVITYPFAPGAYIPSDVFNVYMNPDHADFQNLTRYTALMYYVVFARMI